MPLSTTDKQRNIIITGGTRGIGQALCRRFFEMGWQVFTCSQSQSYIIEDADHKGVIRCTKCNLASSFQRICWMDNLPDEIAVLVNNAAVYSTASPHSGPYRTADHLREALEVNTIAPAALTAFAGKAMTDHPDGGTIVNVTSSVTNFRCLINKYAYAASKAALDMITRSMADTFRPAVRVNAICPGSVDTKMNPADPEKPDIISAAEAAEHIISLIGKTLTDKDETAPTGKFFYRDKEVPWRTKYAGVIA